MYQEWYVRKYIYIYMCVCGIGEWMCVYNVHCTCVFGYTITLVCQVSYNPGPWTTYLVPRVSCRWWTGPRDSCPVTSSFQWGPPCLWSHPCSGRLRWRPPAGSQPIYKYNMCMYIVFISIIYSLYNIFINYFIQLYTIILINRIVYIYVDMLPNILVYNFEPISTYIL